MKQPRARRTSDDGSLPSPPRWLTVQTRSDVLAVAGEIDAATAPAVTAALEPLITAGAQVRAIELIGRRGDIDIVTPTPGVALAQCTSDCAPATATPARPLTRHLSTRCPRREHGAPRRQSTTPGAAALVDRELVRCR